MRKFLSDYTSKHRLRSKTILEKRFSFPITLPILPKYYDCDFLLSRETMEISKIHNLSNKSTIIRWKFDHFPSMSIGQFDFIEAIENLCYKYNCDVSPKLLFVKAESLG